MKLTITIELKKDTSRHAAECLAEAVLNDINAYDPEYDGIDLRANVESHRYDVEE